MFRHKTPKAGNEPASNTKIDSMSEVALAAITSSKNQTDVGEFMSFFLNALERNADWLNDIVKKQAHFRCALMVGAGPNRFQLQDIIYPTNEKDIKFEVEIKDSEDYDKVAIVALVKLSNADIDKLLRFLKCRLFENALLREDLLKGKEMGIHFAVLRPFSEKQYRVTDRIVIGNFLNVTSKKRRRDEKPVKIQPKKAKRVY